MVMRTLSKTIVKDHLPIIGNSENEPQYKELYQELNGVMLWNSPNLLESVNPVNQAGMILNALLAQAVDADLLQDPFTFVGKVDADLKTAMNKYRDAGSGMLRHAHLPTTHRLTVHLDDARTAHAWRAETLRRLYPQIQDSSDEEVASSAKKFNQRVAAVARNKAKKFLDSGAASLIDEAKINAEANKNFAICSCLWRNWHATFGRARHGQMLLIPGRYLRISLSRSL